MLRATIFLLEAPDHVSDGIAIKSEAKEESAVRFDRQDNKRADVFCDSETKSSAEWRQYIEGVKDTLCTVMAVGGQSRVLCW
jgi:hypothetical protein